LSELQQWFKAKEDGKTWKEFFFLADQKARPKRGLIDMAKNTPMLVQAFLCVQSGDQVTTFTCLAGVLGSKVMTIDAAEVAYFVQQASGLMKTFLKTKGWLDSATGLYEAAKNWYFGTAKPELEKEKTEVEQEIEQAGWIQSAKNWWWGNPQKRDLSAHNQEIAKIIEANLVQKIAAIETKTNFGKVLDELKQKFEGKQIQKREVTHDQVKANYAAVLDELQEWFKAKADGKTLKEFLASKKAAKAA